MEEERYIYTKIDGYYWIKDTKTNENYCANKTIVKLLNQQDKSMKELESRVEKLKDLIEFINNGNSNYCKAPFEIKEEISNQIKRLKEE